MTKSKKILGFVFIIASLAAIVPSAPVQRAFLPTDSSARSAMVASQHELASKIGNSILKKGGNAVDAAIAVGFALAVVYPEAGNIGGGGFMVIRLADGRTAAIDYREMAPAAAERDIYLDSDGKVKTGEGGPVIGYRSAGVPGTVAGFELAYRNYGSGKVTWAELVQPARILASDGFVLSRRLAGLFKSYRSALERYEETKRIFLNGGDLLEEGDVLRQPDLARTLRRIEKSGASEFYEGETARLIAEDMKRNDGLITLADLKAYKAVLREALTGTYRGHKVISMPPPSSGGIVLIQVLNMLEGYDLASMEHNSAAKYHVLAESMKRAFADRAELMGDPDFAMVPTSRLIEKAYAEKRSASIRADKATPSAELGPGLETGEESLDTTHFSVVDSSGNAVANTYTINNIYGSAVTAKGTGILLNDEMDDFASRPGQPNMFGLVQGEANSIEPGKRPLSSMTPTIVLRPDGTFWFAVGARGGPRIISAVIHITINMIDHGMDLQSALDAPRIHHQWLPDEIVYEPYGLSPDTRGVLNAFGHRFGSSTVYLASGTGVAVDKDGYRIGAIDRRSDGAAIGY